MKTYIALMIACCRVNFSHVFVCILICVPQPCHLYGGLLQSGPFFLEAARIDVVCRNALVDQDIDDYESKFLVGDIPSMVYYTQTKALI